MNSKNKKYLIWFIGIIVVFILFAGFIFFQAPKQQPTPALQEQNSISQQQSRNTTNNSSLTKLPPPASSPKAAALQFYNYYFSTPENPLANGAYKNNPYLSSDFKTVIGGLYANGNAPVFCPQNERKNVVVGKEQSIYYNNSYLEQEVISEAPPGSKDLYTILLENVNGKWLIFDVNCDS